MRLNGYKLNVLDLLASYRTLLILDNIGVDINTDVLAELCGPRSRVLITSQVEFGANTAQVGFVGRERAREILSAGTGDSCPDAVLDAVLQAVEGHPLVLRMLNQLATQGHSWFAIGQQCSHIAGAPDEKRRTVAARILEQHLNVLGRELAFFGWCRSASVDRGFFESAFGVVGIGKLQRWALTARGQSDAIRLHDLVYASIERLRDRLPLDAQLFEAELEQHLGDQLAPKRLGFFRVVNRHRGLIERLLTARPLPSALRYAYLHGHQPSRLSPALIGDPAIDAVAGPVGDRRVWLLSIVEAIEADYRRVRDLGDKPAAKAMLESRLPTFDLLVVDRRLTAEEQAIARHHRAKSLLKLGRVDETLSDLEVVATQNGAFYASKLQLARLSTEDPDRAKAFIFEIIHAEYTRAGGVATSVLMETLSTLRRQHLRRSVSEMIERYGPFMAQRIKAAACSGEDQPVRAFAAVGSEWAYKVPELFVEVLEAIDLGSPSEAEDDDERVAIGRLLTSAGKILLRQGEAENARRRFRQSDAFFEKVGKRSGFVCTHHADALLRLNEAQQAAQVLDAAPPKQREAFWLYRRSEAHLAQDEFPQALRRIDEALSGLDLQERRSTFLAQRADVLFAMEDPAHERTLREAIQLCDDHQYRHELESRLGRRMNTSA